MEVPIKFVYDKRDQRCAALVGTAKRGMLILERMMAFQNLQQLQYRFEPYPGAEVICSKIYGTRVVKINVAPVGGEKRIAVHKKCLCFPHVTVGFIVKIYPDDVPLTDETLHHGRFYYDMMLCAGRQYVFAPEVWAAGWEQYFVGQMVLVSIGGQIDVEEYPDYPEYDCDRFCLLQNPPFTSLVIIPFNIPGEMKKWARITQEMVY